MEGSLVSLNSLLTGNQVFDIPVYQRGYAWERENLEDLWEDLYYLDPFKKHYFGTVLLKNSGRTAMAALATLDRLDVIDGQQRLTTVLILLREVISQLKEVGDGELRGDLDNLERVYLKDGANYKLNPPGEDGSFFHQVVIDGKDFLTGEAKTRSQRRMAEARTFYRERLIGEKEREPLEYEGFLVGLKQKIDNLQLIQYRVDSGTDAIRIFETVNDRGRPLSNLEKTKSFLMHTTYLGIEDEAAVAARLEELNGHFSRIYGHFEDASGPRHRERLRLGEEDDLLRYHFINYVSPDKDTSSRPFESLKKIIRDKLRKAPGESADYAIDYAVDLEKAFLAVKKIAEANRQDKRGGPLSKLFMLDRMANILPLLIASWLRFGGDGPCIGRILKLLEAFIVRVYLLGGYRRDTAMAEFHRKAHRVHGKVLDYDGLLAKLSEAIDHFLSNDRFERTLGQEDLYGRLTPRDMKFLLSEYEIHLRAEGDVPLAVATQEMILTAEYEVEHIWPQTPSYAMTEEEESEHRHNVHRLGNLTIASKSWNASMGNKTFQEKKSSYSNSNLLVQQELANFPSWDIQAINDREARIVAFAMQRWSV